MSIDMSQFYQVFFEETSEHLANMERQLLDLDVENPSLEELNAIFRAAHSIKGGSGTFGFTDMTEVTHILETLLDRLRKEELALQPEMVDAFLAAGDVLRAQLECHQGGPAPDPAQIEEVCARLNQLASGEDESVATVASSPVPDANVFRRLTLMCALPDEVIGAEGALDNLIAGLAELADIDVTHSPSLAEPQFCATLATYRTDAEIRDVLTFYVAADAVQLAPLQEEDDGEGFGFFDDVPGLPGAEETADAGDSDPGYGFFDDEPSVPNVQDTNGLTISGEGDIREERDSDGVYGLFEDAAGKPEHLLNRDIAAADSPAAIEGPGYGIYLKGPGGLGLFDSAPGTEGIVGERSSQTATATAQAASATSGKPGAMRKEQDKTGAAANTDTSIRVSVEKVDQLINLVGELVITQAMLAEAASTLDPVQAEKLLAGIDLLSRNTRDMQESVMSIRMLPMSVVFSRFPRVVRDLAGKLGKQVEMKTIGENTELDKGLIEKISDPLTHLVRNSLDHGIEVPERRTAIGKNAKGTLTLKASHQGGNIVIEVMDDGAGLNRDRILAKAREKGMAVSDAMTDHEVWQLIFAPGFSTADQVTDVSGRGVGMDVVKRNIESMGGKVELQSSTGHGTRTVIRLPLTLAILDGMSVGVGGETFIVPLTVIVESLQPNLDDIRTMAGDSRMVHIRGEYLPFISLAEVFGLPGVDDITRGIVVVVEAEEGKAALFVDELLGQHQVVIKSLEANYRKVSGVSGATIMGDGRVAMILDVSAVTRMGLMARSSEQRRAA